MPRKRRKRAVLEREDIPKIRAAADARGPHDRALIEWLYTHGARASEPGLALLDDVDLRSGRVQLTHLKNGLEPEWLPLAAPCLKALKMWLLTGRPSYTDGRKNYVFPSTNPGPCYPCRGKGKILRKRRDKEPELVKCPHCHASGTRWGLSRHEVRRIVEAVFKAAGIPLELRFPHVLRHSAATHLLDSGATVPAVQERLGHKSAGTTFGYMQTTKAAREAVNKAFDEE